MNDAANTPTEEKKPKFRGCLIAVLILLMLIIAVPVGLIVIDHIPRTIDTDTSGKYTVKLQATSSPDWPFGAQDGRVVLKDNDKMINSKVCSVDFSLSNDGKSMGPENWQTEWKDDSVIITIKGEEQSDALYTLYFNGEVYP